MRVTISNFGPIKQFEFDLCKDLIITYGMNNIGKSYAMQSLYLILKHLLDMDCDSRNFYIEDVQGLALEIKYSLKSLESTKYIDLTDKINGLLLKFFNSKFKKGLENSFENTFGELAYSGSGTQDGASIDISVENIFVRIIIDKGIEIRNCEFKNKVFIGIPYSESNVALRRENGVYLHPGKEETIDDVSLPNIQNMLNSHAMEEIRSLAFAVSKYISGIYFFPASRSGIYSGMSAFAPIMAEYSKNRELLKDKIELPSISEPIADYLILLSGVSGSNTPENELSIPAKEIEKEILKGEVTFDSIKKTLLYKPLNMNTRLKMNHVSSMVSEISPIVAFLKYIVDGRKSKQEAHLAAKPIIFIEEPEAHLHPENQLKLAEVFVMLVKSGMKIVASSHSNYIFNKLNNMVLEGVLPTSIYSPVLLGQTLGGSVSKQMEMSKFGVEDENFMDVIERLYEEREEIIERINLEAESDDNPDKDE